MKLPKWMIKFAGNLYLHKFPMFAFYKPNIHKVRGDQVAEVLDLLQNGDFLVRRFDGYLSTFFIPGFWTHVGMYYDNSAIHSIGDGVLKEHVLNFCRTDSIAILRVKDKNLIPKAIQKAETCIGIDYDFEFETDNEDLYCTEFMDVCYDRIFDGDYESITGIQILTPDGLFDSNEVDLIYEFRS